MEELLLNNIMSKARKCTTYSMNMIESKLQQLKDSKIWMYISAHKSALFSPMSKTELRKIAIIDLFSI